MRAFRLPPISLRSWLFLLMLAALLPIGIFAIGTSIEFAKATREGLLDDLSFRARALQRATDRSIDLAITEVHGIADSGSAQRGDWSEVYKQAQRITQRNPAIRAVTLVDREKNVLFFTGTPFGTPPFKANSPDMIDAVLQTGRANVSTAFKSPSSSRMVVAVSVPLRQEGEIRYVLRAILLTDTLEHVLQDAQLPTGWIAGIADSKGVLLARSAAPELFVGQPASPSFLEGIRISEGRPFEGVTLEGDSMMVVVLPVHGGDWFLGIGVPTAVLDAGLGRTMQHTVTLAAIGLGLALFLSFLCSQQLLRQVRLLVGYLMGSELSPRAEATLKVKELLTALAEIRLGRQRERDALGHLNSALTERDAISDLYEHAPCGYHSLDAQSRLVKMNATALAWLGYTWEEVRGTHFPSLLSARSRVAFAEEFPKFLAEGHVENLELELLRKDESLLPVVITATAVRDADGNFICSRSTTFDLTERKRLESQLNQLARTDMLTGLSNRRDFYEQAEREVQRSQRHQKSMALLMIDIDHFKLVNDEHGHLGGDKILQAVAATCKATLRRVDLVARVGGEEFAALLPETSLELAQDIAERLGLTVAQQETELPSGRKVKVTLSIGIARYEASDFEVDSLMARADGALYESKRQGRNRVTLTGALPRLSVGR